MSEERTHGAEAVMTVTKTLSEADVALFELVTRDMVLATDDPPSAPMRKPRQIAPFALIGAVMASAAARHARVPDIARFEQVTVRFTAPAYTDDTVSAVAELAGYDEASHRLTIRAHCDNQEGVRLAEGEFILTDG